MSLIKRFFKEVNKKEVISWAFFDFANSSYSLLIITFIFPIFFKEVIAGQEFGDFYWGLITSISILAGGLVAPIIGAIADYDKRRKTKFILFALLAMIGTASLYFTSSSTLLFASLLFIATNFFFELATVMYDSFLLHVSTKETAGRISGLGWGLGYLGGITAMLLLRPFYSEGYIGVLESTYKLTFPLTALFFFIFSLPIFIFLKDKEPKRKKESLLHLAKIGIRNTFSTIRDIKKHKNIAWFLLAFYLMNDALVTLFTFISIYARTTLSIPISEISLLLLIIQLIGFPAAVFFGWLSDKKGAKKILLFTLAFWSLIIILLSLATSKYMFYLVSIMAGLVVGSSQAIARSWLSKIIPDEKRSEFFGFNGFASKVSATTGPLVFGTISILTGNQRFAMIALLLFFIASFSIFSRISEESGEDAIAL